MTQKLQNGGTAALVSLVLVLLSILLGARLSLGRLRADYAMVFQYGNDGSWRGIADDLDSIADNSYNLITVAERYLYPEDMHLDAVDRALDNLYSYSSYGMQHMAAEELREAVEALSEELQTMGLSDSDEVYRQKIMANIYAGYNMIDKSGYNTAAREFNRKLQVFPANILSSITGVEPLELYE